MACNHRHWTAHTVDNFRRGMTSPPLDNTHSRQRRMWHDDVTALGQYTRLRTSGVAWLHRPWTTRTVGNVRRGMTSPPLDSTHGRQHQAWHDDIIALGQHTRSTMSGMECHHLLCTAHTVGNVRRGMTSPPLDSTHGRQRWALHDDNTSFGQHT